MTYTVSAEADTGLALNENDTVSSVLQNLSILLRTRQDSVPMFREFGLPMNFIDRPMQLALPTLLVEVQEAIEQFEPRAELVSVNLLSAENGKLVPQVEVNIINE